MTALQARRSPSKRRLAEVAINNDGVFLGVESIMKNRRKQLVVDSKVQRGILKRVFIYWLFCVLFIMTPLVMVSALSQPELHLGQHQLR